MATTRSIGAVPRSSSHALTMQRWRALRNFATAMLFLLPSLAVFIYFVFIPLVKTVLLSLYLTDPIGRPSTFIGLALLQDQERFLWNVVMAGVVIILIPTFALFIAGNRQLIRGLTAGLSRDRAAISNW